MGNWIRVQSGRAINFATFDVQDVDLGDIAHALANINRFTGHTLRPYSVAEHCVRGSYLVWPEFALEWMLHDAQEAYLGDVSSPLKSMIGSSYAALEKKFAGVIAERYRLVTGEAAKAEVKRVDALMLRCEMSALLPGNSGVFARLDHSSTDVEECVAVEMRNAAEESYREKFLLRMGELIEQRYVALVKTDGAMAWRLGCRSSSNSGVSGTRKQKVLRSSRASPR
jgi:hypothetical protein